MIRTFVVSLVVALVSALPADAQYFGRNKVEYHDFDFRILETEHFDVYYYPREERAALDAAAQVARATHGNWLRPHYRWLDARWSGTCG